MRLQITAGRTPLFYHCSNFFLKRTSSMNKNIFYAVLIFSLLISNFFAVCNNIHAQEKLYSSKSLHPLSTIDLLALNLNLNRIEVQLNILSNKINNHDQFMMFEHAYIMHSTIFPSVLNFTNTLNQQKSQQLEGLLADLPIMIKSNQNPALFKNEIRNIENIIQDFYSIIHNSLSTKEYQLLSSQTVLHLLNDSKVSYKIYT